MLQGKLKAETCFSWRVPYLLSVHGLKVLPKLRDYHVAELQAGTEFDIQRRQGSIMSSVKGW
jgi:hypothetical protein